MITLDIGLDMLWNRIAVLLFFLTVLLVLAYKGLSAGWNNHAIKILKDKALLFSAIKVKIKSENKVWGGNNVIFACQINGRKRNFISLFRKHETPFYLGEKEALAVMPGEGFPPILLDSALSRLDLTPEEREASRGQLTA